MAITDIHNHVYLDEGTIIYSKTDARINPELTINYKIEPEEKLIRLYNVPRFLTFQEKEYIYYILLENFYFYPLGKNREYEDFENYTVKENGYRTVTFELNGMIREVEIRDKNYCGSIKDIVKADMNNPLQVGASIPGKVVKILVQENEIVKQNQPLIIIEAMKMETVIVSKIDGTIKSIKVLTNDMVKDNQLLIELS